MIVISERQAKQYAIKTNQLDFFNEVKAKKIKVQWMKAQDEKEQVDLGYQLYWKPI